MTKYNMLSGGIAISVNEDLNSAKFFTIGNYYCSINNVVATLKNCPCSNAFTMKVEHAVGNNAYPCQTIRDFFTGEIYYRVKVESNQIRNWVKFVPIAI